MSDLNAIYRRRWEQERKRLEDGGLRAFPLHEKTTLPRKDPLRYLLYIFGFFLRLFGLFRLGKKQALKLRVTENSITSSYLAQGNLKILHLSDLHLDEFDRPIEDLISKINEAGDYHFCVITGDFFTGWPSHDKVKIDLKKLLSSLEPKISTLAVLGNHDSRHLVEFLENEKVIVLTNQIKTYMNHPSLPMDLEIIGTDDPHYFFQKDAQRIFSEGRKEIFRLALVHSPELFEIAADSDCDLYLCGHTHAGQVALPGKIKPLKRVYKGKQFAEGPWRHGTMNGFTSSGIGTSTLPVRFFTTAEIIIHKILPFSRG